MDNPHGSSQNKWVLWRGFLINYCTPVPALIWSLLPFSWMQKKGSHNYWWSFFTPPCPGQGSNSCSFQMETFYTHIIWPAASSSLDYAYKYIYTYANGVRHWLYIIHTSIDVYHRCLKHHVFHLKFNHSNDKKQTLLLELPFHSTHLINTNTELTEANSSHLLPEEARFNSQGRS